MGFSTEKLKPK